MRGVLRAKASVCYLHEAGRMRLVVIVLLALVVACSHTAVDKPLEHWTPQVESVGGLQANGSDPHKVTVLLGFSGGGTRNLVPRYP